MTSLLIKLCQESQRRHSKCGGFSIDTRRHNVVVGDPSQPTCPLSHIPAKTPQLTLSYPIREDTTAFASLAAQLLQSPTARQSSTSAGTQLPTMVSKLVNTTRVFTPPSLCAASSSTDPAHLAAWDCSSHLLHVCRLLLVVSCIMVDYNVRASRGRSSPAPM